MSIVYEYLKEAEEKKKSGPNQRIVAPAPKPQVPKIVTSPSAVIPKPPTSELLQISLPKKTRWRLSFWIALAGVCAGMSLFFIAGFYIAKEMKPSYRLRKARFAGQAQHSRQAKAPASQPLTLEGIVYDVASPFVVINGKILERRGVIDGYTLIEISRSEVRLKNFTTNKTKHLVLSD